MEKASVFGKKEREREREKVLGEWWEDAQVIEALYLGLLANLSTATVRLRLAIIYSLYIIYHCQSSPAIPISIPLPTVSLLYTLYPCCEAAGLSCAHVILTELLRDCSTWQAISRAGDTQVHSDGLQSHKLSRLAGDWMCLEGIAAWPVLLGERESSLIAGKKKKTTTTDGDEDEYSLQAIGATYGQVRDAIRE